MHLIISFVTSLFKVAVKPNGCALVQLYRQIFLTYG